MILLRRSNYCLKFLILPSELLGLFYEIYLDLTLLFVGTKLVSRCGLTTVCNRVYRHDVLQLLLIISYMNRSDSKIKEAKQQQLEKVFFTLFIYFIVKTLLIL